MRSTHCVRRVEREEQKNSSTHCVRRGGELFGFGFRRMRGTIGKVPTRSFLHFLKYPPTHYAF